MEISTVEFYFSTIGKTLTIQIPKLALCVESETIQPLTKQGDQIPKKVTFFLCTIVVQLVRNTT